MLAKRIAIVGGGPAGSFVATELARAGREVLLFDEKLAWEKPCGGGLTEKALTRWPFLRDAPAERNWISSCELTSPSRRRVSFQLDRQIAVFSRLTLNGLLLERARSAGAQVIHERIIEIGGSPGEWHVKSHNSTYRADFVVVSAGARNPFRRQFAMPLGADNFMVAAGYYISGTHNTVHIKFMRGLHGYIWVFPRSDHFSVGICGRMHDGSTAKLRKTLEASLPELGLSLDGARFYAHIIPSLSVSALRNTRFCGEGWAMIGDAAGFVDAITGEGIFYALHSAELLSEALLNNAPENYSALVQRDLLPELEHASRIAERFYAGEWMGTPLIERMIHLTARSPRFRELMRDLFAGAQDYATLKQRVYRSLPKIAAQALVSALWQPTGELYWKPPSQAHHVSEWRDKELSFRASFSGEESVVAGGVSKKQIPHR
jgi:geranylgeranyl diphosphate/geranylgeranyl-bacteriochlorophyllide a reductase